MENLRTPFSLISQVLLSRTEGLGFNATCRVYLISARSLRSWEKRFGRLKSFLMTYSLTHSFIKQVVEGDELYTKVGSNVPQEDSEGWTILLIERASRFIWALECGKKDENLFIKAIKKLSEVIQSTSDLSLLTDGERRYGNKLFQICHEVLKTGKPGRPKKVLKKGVKVRVKNKGSQSHKLGRKRPKYQSPQSEHPLTKQDISDHSINANHAEAFNASLRRRNSAYRRKTNTYAKLTEALQRTLDVYWVVHNFIRKHYTTKRVPAENIGIIEEGLSFFDLLNRVR
tara:strand:+ start:245 stop:1102 length:858 start_codon:yes stop_codon:yes gene_type:complete